MAKRLEVFPAPQASVADVPTLVEVPLVRVRWWERKKVHFGGFQVSMTRFAAIITIMSTLGALVITKVNGVANSHPTAKNIGETPAQIAVRAVGTRMSPGLREEANRVEAETRVSGFFERKRPVAEHAKAKGLPADYPKLYMTEGVYPGGILKFSVDASGEGDVSVGTYRPEKLAPPRQVPKYRGWHAPEFRWVFSTLQLESLVKAGPYAPNWACKVWRMNQPETQATGVINITKRDFVLDPSTGRVKSFDRITVCARLPEKFEPDELVAIKVDVESTIELEPRITVALDAYAPQERPVLSPTSAESSK